jgi:hypothetical protein
MTIGTIDVHLSSDFEGSPTEVALALTRAGRWSESIGLFEAAGERVVYRPALVRNPHPKPLALGVGESRSRTSMSLEALCELVAPALDAGFVRVSTTAFEDDDPVRVSRLTLTSAWSAYLEVHHPGTAPPRLLVEEWI